MVKKSKKENDKVEEVAGDGTGIALTEIEEKSKRSKIFDPKQETIKRNRQTTEKRQQRNKMRRKGFCLDKEELYDGS